MANKLFLFLILMLSLGISSCSKGPRPTLSFISDIKEENRSDAKDGSFIYSHFLNVEQIKQYNEQKLDKTDFEAEFKMYHLSGFKKLVENAEEIPYRLFEGDSTEVIYPKKDSALMVLVGMTISITDRAGKKVVDVKDLLIPGQVGTAKVPYKVDSTHNLNSSCISVTENISSKLTFDRNTYYKNMQITVRNKQGVLSKGQKYKIYFRVFDKLDPNRYLEGGSFFIAYN
ncbi:MAG: hypothetical protein Q8908_03225 [Bacteroidota bacterium]|nr:hypothetical protein [Bacteroidota bacterium]